MLMNTLLDNKRLILASASPRRRELIQKLGLDFEAETSEADEKLPDYITEPEDAPEYLSGIKAEAVYDKHTDEDVLVVGSDTVVILDGEIYGKPVDEDDAFRMLKSLSGRWHEVVTGVTIISGVPGSDRRQQISFSVSTRVKFYQLGDDEIRDYIAGGEPMDKAGAYGIQQGGALIVERIDGDFFAVMGLPIAALSRRLREISI